MCMRNLNATILTCVDAKRNSKNSNVLTYSDVFDVIVPEEIDGKFYVSNIDIVINMVAMFDDKNEGYTFERNKTYNCMLAVTHDGNKFKGFGQFDFFVDSEKLSSCGQRDFYNTTFLVENQMIEIPENATQCDLVLLIKYPPEDDNGKWIIQTIKRLYINKIQPPVTNI